MRKFVQHIGARLKQLREEAGLSVLDLANATQTHKSTIYNIEAGRHPPSVTHLFKIAQALRCDELDLLTFPGAHPRHDIIELLRGQPTSAVASVRDAAERLLKKAR